MHNSFVTLEQNLIENDSQIVFLLIHMISNHLQCQQVVLGLCRYLPILNNSTYLCLEKLCHYLGNPINLQLRELLCQFLLSLRCAHINVIKIEMRDQIEIFVYSQFHVIKSSCLRFKAVWKFVEVSILGCILIRVEFACLSLLDLIMNFCIRLDHGESLLFYLLLDSTTSKINILSVGKVCQCFNVLLVLNSKFFLMLLNH